MSCPFDVYLQTASCELSVPKNTTARSVSLECMKRRDYYLLVTTNTCTDRITSMLLMWKPGWP